MVEGLTWRRGGDSIRVQERESVCVCERERGGKSERERASVRERESSSMSASNSSDAAWTLNGQPASWCTLSPQPQLLDLGSLKFDHTPHTPHPTSHTTHHTPHTPLVLAFELRV